MEVWLTSEQVELRNEGGIRGAGTRVLAAFIAIALSYFFIALAYEIRTPDDGIIVTGMPTPEIAVPLESGKVFRQEIDIHPDGPIQSIRLMFGTYQRANRGTLSVRLLEDEKEVASWTLMTRGIVDSGETAFPLEDPFAMKRRSTYTLEISETYRGDNAIALWTSNSDSGGYDLDGAFESGRTACYRVEFMYPYSKTLVKILAAYAALVVLGIAIWRIKRRKRA